MGRRPAENPQNVALSFRVTEEVASALDAEIALDSRPGLRLSRADVARMLMAEGLEARLAARKPKPKK